MTTVLIYPTPFETEAADHLRRLLDKPWDADHCREARAWLARFDAMTDPKAR